MAAREVHHRVPRCLIGLRERADEGSGIGGEGIQAWLDWEFEAVRCGVDPDIPCERLADLVEGSTVEMGRDEHRAEHAEDFARWGRRGGLATLRRYGSAWFSLLARRRWGRITAQQLAEAFEAMSGGRS
jgi:hypothetical protein